MTCHGGASLPNGASPEIREPQRRPLSHDQPRALGSSVSARSHGKGSLPNGASPEGPGLQPAPLTYDQPRVLGPAREDPFQVHRSETDTARSRVAGLSPVMDEDRAARAGHHGI